MYRRFSGRGQGTGEGIVDEVEASSRGEVGAKESVNEDGVKFEGEGEVVGGEDEVEEGLGLMDVMA